MPGEGQQLRVGIVGAGYIADYHVRALRRLPGVDVVAVCDLDRRAAERMARAHEIPASHADLSELLQRERLSAAHVLVPPDRHLRVGRMLIDAGVHTLFEKPLCSSSAECDELIELARARGVKLGTSHNFLFSPAYERLRRAHRERWLGRIDAIDVIWNKHLPLARSGPFSAWMLQAPGNVLLEVGPHSLANVLDLAGELTDARVRAFGNELLPNGAVFHDRWEVTGQAGGALVHLRFSFVSGYTEHVLRVRGTLASASVDFERNTYLLHHHRPLAMDLDRFASTASESADALVQAARTLSDYARYKAKLGGDGPPFQASITRSVRAFYASLGGELDERQAGQFSRRVVALGERLVNAAGLPSAEAKLAVSGNGNGSGGFADVLVTGGGGFIGRALVKKLVLRGYKVRVVSRGGVNLPPGIDASAVEVAVGSLGDRSFVARALGGVRWVFHLARSHGTSWKDFENNDVGVTRELAARCLSRGVERFVYSSSIAIYYAGRRAGRITEATPADRAVVAHQAYARAKLESEQLLVEMFRRASLPVVIVRPGIVIGSGGDPRHWGVGMWPYPSVCEVWGDGDTKLPLVLVDDVAEAMIRCIETRGIEGESFNLVGEPFFDAGEYLDELERHGGVRLIRRRGPIWRFFAADSLKWVVKTVAGYPDRTLPSYRAWEGRTAAAFFDCTKAKRLLGWQPTSDRDTLVEAGIRAPALEFVA
jgi:nucleoside-diphosphate-sugar epimerase/predicted dehydrogenase